MKTSLYPLQFHTIFKDKIWGGHKIRTILGKDFSPLPNCGETWEISAVEGNVSVVKNGDLAGKDLKSLINTYKGELVGNKVYNKFGDYFPLLVKFIDASDDLSIQVHPNDEVAKKRHNSYGKTEMWYIFQADEGAVLNVGFNQPMDKDTYLKHLNNGTLMSVLNFEKATVGDVFFMPAGRIHYIGKGICLAEIQQTSDITYRIYDFDRRDSQGNLRELHTEEAVDVIDYQYYPEYKIKYNATENTPNKVVSCPYFETQLLVLSDNLVRDFSNVDSFVIYMCVGGEATINTISGKVNLTLGGCVLLPASINKFEITPITNAKLLECYVP